MICSLLSKPPTAVTSRDLPPGEISPKEESLEPRSGEDGDCGRRSVTLILGSVRNAARGAWKRAMADRAEKARARRKALLLGIIQDAARDASKKVTTDRVKRAAAISTLRAKSMARRIQRWYRFGRNSTQEWDRRILQRYLNTAAEYNWKYFGSGFYSGSEDSGYWDAFKHARNTFDDPPETDIKSWSDNFESSTWSLFETAFEGYFDGYEEKFYSKEMLLLSK